MEGGVARVQVDLNQYRERLHKLQSRSHQVMSTVFAKARAKASRIVFREGDDPRVLQAAHVLREEGICEPILLGKKAVIEQMIAERRLEEELAGIKIIDASKSEDRARYSEALWKKRQRHGVNRDSAYVLMGQRGYYGSMMVELGEADGFVTGLTQSYAEAVLPALETIGVRPGRRAAGVYLVVTRNDFKFFADCTLNPDPPADHLAQIAVATSALASYFDVTPRVAFLSYANFGDANGGGSPAKMRHAMELAQQLRPDLVMDGEMQVDSALVEEERMSRYPFTKLTGDANVLIFPNLDAANIAYKLLWRFGGAEVIGPILLGMNKAVNVLQQNAGTDAIVNLAAVTALRAHGGEFLF
jgi:malate dehydrogenase (oxaloacetate-decarboxylating)(NADP+)